MVDSMPTWVGAAVEDEIDAAVEVGAHMLRQSSATRGRTDWRRARPPACRMPSADRARPDAPARAPRSSRVRRSPTPTTGQPSAFGNTSVSGPGQNASASFFARNEKRANAKRRGGARHMRDQRIEARPALRRIEPRDRLAVRRVCAEPVDRLGRKRDEPALGKHARCRRDRVVIGVEHTRGQFDSHGAFRYGDGAGTLASKPQPSRVTTMTYRAPVSDIAFTLKHSAGLKQAHG